MPPSLENQPYFPPPESNGGWRWLMEGDQVRSLGGMDPIKLERLRKAQEDAHPGDSWSIVVIRHGYLVKEIHTFNVLVPTRFDIWSCTKSFTGTIWGFVFDDSRQNRLPDGVHIDLDTPAYPFIPEGYPLSDPRKEHITFRHLLSMSSGIGGEDSGAEGIPTATDHGPFEHALGHSPNRFGNWVAKLAGDPGMHWEYSDPGICHLALAFARIMGKEMDTVLQERVCAPIGIENMSWDIQGGSGFIGPHTNAHTGVHISAREFARLGYLYLHNGVWNSQQVIPAWWRELSTRQSQNLNPEYGYTWWVNNTGERWPDLPRDTYAASGYRSNRCYIIPSLDLVVARVGSGPASWDEQHLIKSVADAIMV
jgi:CubicO group peptidase (beta-lactamase class C family)